MEQLGYTNPVDYSLYWLLQGKDFGSGLRIVDSDVDTLHMIAVVPKFQYFQLFVDHKKLNTGTAASIDDVVIVSSPMSEKNKGKAAADCTNASKQQQHAGHETRRSRRKLSIEEEDTNTWKWFLGTVKDDLGVETTRPWTFISDRRKVICNLDVLYSFSSVELSLCIV
jgi:hypothetical protein